MHVGSNGEKKCAPFPPLEFDGIPTRCSASQWRGQKTLLSPPGRRHFMAGP